MSEAIGDRVRARIQDSGRTQLEVATASGMKPDALSRAINGARSFGALELANLADQLHTSLRWLATGEDDPWSTRMAARHSFDHGTRVHEQVDWSRSESQLEAVALAIRQVVDDLPASPPSIPEDPMEVRRCLETAGGPDFVRQLAELIERCFHVHVVRMDGLDRAYSLLVGDHAAIVTSDTPNWFFQNWSLAHELWHLAGRRMSARTEGIANSATEARANAFAAELLLPEEELRSVDWSTVDLGAVATFIWEHGVSTDALRRRLKKLGLLDDERLGTALETSTQRFLRSHFTDADHQPGIDLISLRMEQASSRRFPLGLISAHAEAVAAGRLRASTLAWMLDADEAELEAEVGPAPVGSQISDSELEARLGRAIDA